MRVVSLTCSNTEIVCALGAEGLLVGVDDHSDFPEAVVSRLARVGKDLDVDAARVAALKPDLVLASLTVPGHEKVLDRLAREKLNILVLAPRSIDEVMRDMLQIGGILGRGEAAVQAVAAMRQGLAPVTRATRSRLLVEWWPKPVIGAARRSWVQDLLDRAGIDNVLGDRDVESCPLDEAAVAALEPDAVVISWCGVPLQKYRTEVVARRASLAQSRAVREGHIFPISEAFLGRPGPRLVEGYAALCAIADRLEAR
jgi:iron complex transport system substrate-binding protein